MSLAQLVTLEMMREADAHCPFTVRQGPNLERWQWYADFLNSAITEPNKPCMCCGVTPLGDLPDDDWVAPANEDPVAP